MQTSPQTSTAFRLSANRELILDLFVAAVKQEIADARRESPSIIRDALPELLKKIEQKLEHPESIADSEVEEVGREHAQQRVQLTCYSLGDVLVEYHLLRQIIFDVLLKEGTLSSQETDVINSVIDTGVKKAGEHYMEVTEARLAESQVHFRLLIEGTFEYAIFMLSPDGIVQTWNKGAERIKGYKAEEIIGKHFSIFYPPEAVLSKYPEHELVIAAKEGKFEEEGLRIRKDGTPFQAHVVINALKDEEGKITGFSKVTRDLTDQLNAENHFRTFADSINQLAWMADETGHVGWYNNRWYEYTGTTPSEMHDNGWEKVFHPKELPEILRQWSHSLKMGLPLDMVFPIRAANGQYRSFLTRVVPFRDAEGRIIKWFGTNTDIQDQKDIELALEDANTKAKQALKVRDDFITVASHELKTPLTSLLLQVQMRSKKLMKADFANITTDQIANMIGADKRQLDKISRLIDDMLDVSRITTGNLSITYENFDLCLLIKEVLENYSDQFASKGSEVNVSCLGAVVGNWDRFRIEQAISNLFTNAIKYGDGKDVEIFVSEDKGQAKLVVTDHGLGIEPENLERIFQRFERAISPSEISGLGLGLFIAKQIIELHGGCISVKSTLGEGSSFTVELPLVKP